MKIFGFVLYKNRKYLEEVLNSAREEENILEKGEDGEPLSVPIDYKNYKLVHTLHNGIDVEVKRTLLREELK